MTGRYSANTGLTWALVPGTPAGLPDDIPVLPETLRQLGYRTAMAGKWHLGHAQMKQTPVGKGFERHVGSYMWDLNSYTKQNYFVPWKPVTIDWVDAHANGTHRHYAEPRHATTAITAAAQEMIRNHRADHADEPMFLYVAFTAAHAPLQPLPEHVEKCSHIKHLWRRQFCGMVVGVDEGIKNITQTALAELGQDTILVFSSDNGGSTWFGGLNAPLRGGKSTPLEGGVRVPAFAVDFSEDGAYLGEGNRTYDGLFHISDWFSTLISLAGGGDVSKVPSSHIDGIDASQSLRGLKSSATTSHRSELLVDMYNAEDFIFHQDVGSYIDGDMKIVTGAVRDPIYYYESTADRMNNTDPTPISYLGEKVLRALEAVFEVAPFDATRSTITHSYFHPIIQEAGRIPSSDPKSRVLLFNLTADPTESTNIADSHPEVVRRLQAKLEAIRSQRPPQQKFWMQFDQLHVWPKSFVSGDCSINPSIRPVDCHFTHPWLPDDKDPWDNELVDAKQFADREAIKFALISVVAIFTVSAVLRLLFRQLMASKNPVAKSTSTQKKRD
jgi:arylsulfatase I/J